ncbi:Peptidoglycan-binding protein, CsiV [Halopseudomonas xinjiangensis]|uniref:Peptidoglycan-binding protein, CsiV n=1 Tax=Halopseudomonas xinjiangensis TaxID=487184 RepID=A0A1H1RQ56_9GAMM|nr:CsiV family protein [Halopseudomonas xinjiangensis]SDS37793.1 Peptidoglycan-binding protein, CsiV [Halopseudomonas xinjiangensis]
MKSARSLLSNGAALLCLTLIAASVRAQNPETVIVEVAFFSQPSSRLLPAEPADLDWADQALVLRETANSQVREIDTTRQELNDEMARMSRQGYRLQLHKAWTQPVGLGMPIAVTDTDSPASNMGTDPQRVQGLVGIDQGSGLEANVSFWLNHVAADGSPITERIEQTRKLRLDETHYLDHPSLGVLIRLRAN